MMYFDKEKGVLVRAPPIVRLALRTEPHYQQKIFCMDMDVRQRAKRTDQFDQFTHGSFNLCTMC